MNRMCLWIFAGYMEILWKIIFMMWKYAKDLPREAEKKWLRLFLERTGMTAKEQFHTIHNYIDVDEMILRKGSIAAHKGEKVLIPINMRDGSIIAIGKGNPEWNYSAPHGAGQCNVKSTAKQTVNMDEYREAMKGIYTTSVNEIQLMRHLWFINL